MKNNNKTHYFGVRSFLLLSLFMVAIISLTNCGSSRVVVEERRGFKLRSKPIVIIEPDFVEIKPKGEQYEQELNSEVEEEKYMAGIKAIAKKAGVRVKIVDAQNLKPSDTDYFNYLIPLRKEILHANFTQNVKFRGSKGDGRILFQKEQMQKSPKIRSKYSFLAEKYKTPYFALQGTIKVNAKKKGREMIFYLIVVDVVKGETMYREFREISGVVTSYDMDIILYDSFKILRR